MPLKGSFDKRNITLRKKLKGKFITESKHDFNFWYIDTQRFERHFINILGFMDILRSISLSKPAEFINNIENF